MSMYYYELKKPITHLGIEKTGGHSRISIWINHGFSGILIVRDEELNNTLELFTDEKVIFHSHYENQKGEILKKINETDNLIVISEYGNIINVEELEKKINNARHKKNR